MRDVSDTLKRVYRARSAIVVPGSGTFGMEAVARQFATGRKCLVLRNGWFSYRWTQIFDAGSIPSQATVLKARPVRQGSQAPYAPPPIDEVTRTIERERPALVFAPHVETASGIILPDPYLRAVADAVHASAACSSSTASRRARCGSTWRPRGVDVLISAPQKGWSSSPGCALVMLGETSAGRDRFDDQHELRLRPAQVARHHGDLRKRRACLPRDAARPMRSRACGTSMKETERFGFERARAAQQSLGDRVRAMLAERGFASVAADGFGAPGVVVSYTDDPDIQSGKRFLGMGLQTAAGVPLQCDEPADFRTFRIGLFGLDKLQNIDRSVGFLEEALSRRR